MQTSLLSEYLEVVPADRDETRIVGVAIEGCRVCLKVPLEQWPTALHQQWQQELFFLFPLENRVGRVDARDSLILCHEVTNCPRKTAPETEDRTCRHFNQGLCVAATTVANNFRPLSFGTIGAFHGISKQRVQQIYCAAQRKVIRAAARDPVLREYYTALGLRPENMPDPKKLAANIEELLADN